MLSTLHQTVICRKWVIIPIQGFHRLVSFLREALVGEDRDHAAYLLRRRAPLRYWVMYWLVALAHRLHMRATAREYESALPMVPA